MRTWYSADERGSIIAFTRDSGSLDGINAYDEFGRRQGAGGRFQYTGQMWLSELSLYFYKTRAFSATLGRFMQTDPIGYLGGPNLYAYVGNDPVNFIDPLGLCYDEHGNYYAPATGTHTCTSGGSGHSIYPSVPSAAGGSVGGFFRYRTGSTTTEGDTEVVTVIREWVPSYSAFGRGDGDFGGLIDVTAQRLMLRAGQPGQRYNPAGIIAAERGERVFQIL